MCLRTGRGHPEPRTGTVVTIQACESLSEGRVMEVRWDDDASRSFLVPGADVVVIDEPATTIAAR